MGSTVDLSSVKPTWPLAMSPFIFAHQLIIFFERVAIELTKNCAKHCGPIIPQGIFFSRDLKIV